MGSQQVYQHIFETLLGHFGPQHWWPADTLDELCVGAILTQNVSWTNVEKALARLYRLGLLSPFSLSTVRHDVLADAIRPAGYFNVKARRLKAFANHCVENYGGDISNFLAPNRASTSLRQELLSIKGIGYETADSMRVYGAGHGAFIADAYGRRILARLGLIPDDAPYEETRLLVESNWVPQAPPGYTAYSGAADLWGEFHALLVALGKQHCLKNDPRCSACPLQPRCATGSSAARTTLP